MNLKKKKKKKKVSDADIEFWVKYKWAFLFDLLCHKNWK